MRTKMRATDIFLCHAQLYVFADRWGIAELKETAIKELHATLAVFTLWPQRIVDVAALIKFFFDQSRVRAHGVESGTSLRALMRDYIGCEMETLFSAPNRIKGLLRDEDGLSAGERCDLIEDVMTLIWQRL